MLVVFLLVYCPYALNENEPDYLNAVSLALGLGVCLLHFCNFLVLWLRPQTIRRYPILKRFLRSSLLVDLKDLKGAGQHKLDLMTKNALNLLGKKEREGVLGTHFGRGLHNYSVSGDTVEKSGGFRWTWKRIFDNSAYSEHGLWFSDRLISSNIAQYIVCVYVLIIGISLSRNALENYDEEKAKEQVSDVTAKILDTAVDEGLLNYMLRNFTSVLGSYVQDSERNCTSSSLNDVFDSVCEFGNNSDVVCDPTASVDYLCAFAESTAGNETNLTSLDFTKQLGLLKASGFDVDTLNNTTRNFLDEAASASVDSLYPSSDYM
jgi:hypothetical protein